MECPAAKIWLSHPIRNSSMQTSPGSSSEGGRLRPCRNDAARATSVVSTMQASSLEVLCVILHLGGGSLRSTWNARLDRHLRCAQSGHNLALQLVCALLRVRHQSIQPEPQEPAARIEQPQNISYSLTILHTAELGPSECSYQRCCRRRDANCVK
jgi:hypothetical protein